MPPEEWFLIVLLIVIGGGRFFVGLVAGLPMGGEATIGLLGLILGVWFGLRGLPRRRRPSSDDPCNLHDENDSDRAPPA
jgi:hypothetical protein